VHPNIAFDMLNRKRSVSARIEADSKRTISVQGEPDMGLDELRIECRDSRDRPVELPALGEPSSPARAQPPHRPHGPHDMSRRQLPPPSHPSPPASAPPAPANEPPAQAPQ